MGSRRGGEESEERVLRNLRGGEGGANYVGMVPPSQQDVVPYEKGVEWGLDTRGLRMLAVEVAQEAGVVPRFRCA